MMNKLMPEFTEIRLKLYQNQRILIENYRKLKDLSEDMIVVDNYCITGTFLKITKMNDFTMEIYGKIKEIIVI